jgi:hypothetical protein
VTMVVRTTGSYAPLPPAPVALGADKVAALVVGCEGPATVGRAGAGRLGAEILCRGVVVCDTEGLRDTAKGPVAVVVVDLAIAGFAPEPNPDVDEAGESDRAFACGERAVLESGRAKFGTAVAFEGGEEDALGFALFRGEVESSGGGGGTPRPRPRPRFSAEARF